MWREFLFGRFLTIVCNTISLWFENFYVQIIAFMLHHYCLLVLVFINFPHWMFWWNNNSYFNNSRIRYLKEHIQISPYIPWGYMGIFVYTCRSITPCMIKKLVNTFSAYVNESYTFTMEMNWVVGLSASTHHQLPRAWRLIVLQCSLLFPFRYSNVWKTCPLESEPKVMNLLINSFSKIILVTGELNIDYM